MRAVRAAAAAAAVALPNQLGVRFAARPGAEQVAVEIREDEEQDVKLNEIIQLLLAAGYFRARIKGLSPFDKVRMQRQRQRQSPAARSAGRRGSPS